MAWSGGSTWRRAIEASRGNQDSKQNIINFHAQLQAYEAEKVNLSDAVRDGLYAKREANRNRLKANLPKDIKIKDFIPQGSMAIRTTVQEKNADYDIDDGVAFYAGSLTGRY